MVFCTLLWYDTMVISKCIKSFPVKTLYNAFLLKASLLRLYYIGAVSKWTMAFSLMNLFLKRTWKTWIGILGFCFHFYTISRFKTLEWYNLHAREEHLFKNVGSRSIACLELISVIAMVPKVETHVLTQFKTQAFTVFTQSKTLEKEGWTVCSHIPLENL